MEGFTFSLRLGGMIIGLVAVQLDTAESLACAKGISRSCTMEPCRHSCKFLVTDGSSAGNLTNAAQTAFGHKVVIKRFMITVWGRTGYLQPDLEYASVTGTVDGSNLWLLTGRVFALVAAFEVCYGPADCTSIMTSRSAVLDIGIPAIPTAHAI